jgi:hypothetical protein
MNWFFIDASVWRVLFEGVGGDIDEPRALDPPPLILPLTYLLPTGQLERGVFIRKMKRASLVAYSPWLFIRYDEADGQEFQFG